MRGAAVAAWTVPAVTLATAAPAFAACSANLVLNVSANYLNHTNASTVDPTVLVVNSITLQNTGSQPAQNPQIQLRIPKAHYLVGPRVTTAATVNTGGISGGTVNTIMTSSGDHWLLTLTLGTNLGASETRTISSLRLSFQDGGNGTSANKGGFSWTDAPFRRWAGNAFTMANTATATNAACSTAAHSTSIAATPNSTFAGVRSEIRWPIFTDQMVARIQQVWNAGRSSIGRVTLRIEVIGGLSGRGNQGFNSNVSWQSGTDAYWTQTGTNAGPSQANPPGGEDRWWWTFEADRNGWAPSIGSGGPSVDLDGPPDNDAFHVHLIPNNTSGWALVPTVSMRHFIWSAPHATTRQVNDLGNNSNSW